MSIEIAYTLIPDNSSLLFTVVSGVSSIFYAGFEWYLNGTLVGTESSYTLISPNEGDQVYVKVKDYVTGCPIYWHDGQFYGGKFTGNFSGGTFHYGLLNGIQYVQQLPKPKPFIKILQTK
jgi:hypothetical protein